MKPNRSLRKSSIMIVDDHAMVREGIAELINREPDMQVCCGVASVAEALRVLHEPAAETPAHSGLPDLMIVDISLDGVSGLELVHTVKTRYPQIPMLMMSMHDENLHAERSLRAGAKGYIMKQEAFDKVLVAIRKVLAGEIYLSDSMHSKMLQRMLNPQAQSDTSPISALSDRELEVLRLTGLGFSTAQIAEQLHRSIKTVEANRARIKEKLNLKGNADYVRFAVQWLGNESSAFSAN
ncbi:MAG: response regulator transcription factor [Sulfuricella sp.]|nr:response regulator transcription factor [Sulfuricella sp.]